MTQQQVAPPTTPYGEPISIAAAKKIMAAAEAEATTNKWGVSIAIVDSGANLLMLHRLDNAQLASVRLTEAKARTAVEFRRPTKALEDAVAGGGIGLRVLTFGACLADGGVPIMSAARSSARSACRARRATRMRKWRRREPQRRHDGQARAVSQSPKRQRTRSAPSPLRGEGVHRVCGIVCRPRMIGATAAARARLSLTRRACEGRA